MDQQRFSEACRQAAQQKPGNGIGTLGEKTLHAVLKHYMEPYTGSHEIRIGRYVADIVGEHGIVEIQTRSFDKLRKKLEAFLSVATVTVVYPIARVKWLSWMDPATGEIVSRRKSPKRGAPWQAFPELYRIKPLLKSSGLRLHILLLDMEEVRNLNGWSVDKKRGSSRAERIPVALGEEYIVERPGDYLQLIPPGLPPTFTAKDFQSVSRMTLSASQTALNVLFHMEAVVRVGKAGNAYLYQISE